MYKTSNDIRDLFLKFFENNEHKILPSSSLIPHNDPSLMFVNAGMVQFKNIFVGNDKANYLAVTTSQKCIRAGGKHNDLENVGYTYRHHTFFEMLGNFSFGKYFKEEAIQLAWQFLTEILKLPQSKLYVTVYKSDQKAFDIWNKIVPADKILKIDNDDNFWSMGDTGPCGPCSEIFYDYGEDSNLKGKWALDENGRDLFEDRFVEIWNLVFMEYERFDNGEMKKLKTPAVDTGMGLERITSVMQDTYNNYDTDILKSIIDESKKITGNNNAIIPHRIVADHIRSISFLIADGVLPSNEGRGYVLRRIMRRAILQANKLNYNDLLLHKLVNKVIELMGDNYNELIRAKEVIIEQCKNEEKTFLNTLNKGLKKLNDFKDNYTKNNILSGSKAFELYDTYGFPLDLTINILSEYNISVDQEEFETEMKKQKERGKKNWKGSEEDSIDSNILSAISELKSTDFIGYDYLNCDNSKIIYIANYINQQYIKSDVLEKGKSIIILDKTPFYPESGGQEADHGELYLNDKKITVYDVQKINNIIIHYVNIDNKIDYNYSNHNITAQVNINRRNNLKKNHTATHLLHKILKNILGNNITQQGSLVAEDKLRFDFSYSKKIEENILEKIEEEINKIIIENHQVDTNNMNLKEAIDSGAEALFGEKYDNEVRVVSIISDNNDKVSNELCGGTHVARTGEIGLIKIVSESSISSGVRRIEAVTGYEAIKFLNKYYNQVNNLANILNSPIKQLEDKIQNLIQQNKLIENEKSILETKLVISNINTVIKNNIEFLYNIVTGISIKEIRNIANNLANEKENRIIVMITKDVDKVGLIISVSKNISKQYSAKILIKDVIDLIGGKGGGGSDILASTGGSNFNNAKLAVDNILNLIK